MAVMGFEADFHKWRYSMITLYQFQFSHYCEKIRWALDYKGLPYTKRNLLPGLHIKVAQKLATKSCLPIIVHGGTVVQDSTAIITFLDKRFPDHPLTPWDSQQAKEALEWEEYFDEEIGIPLRLLFYYHTLPDRDRALRFILNGAPWYGRPLFALIFPKVRTAMMERMNIHAESAKQSEERLLAALERLESALKERRFLVGDHFSRADLTACALLSSYCAPGKSDTEASATLPGQVCALRNKHKTSHFFGWVRDIYTAHRHVPAGNAWFKLVHAWRRAGELSSFSK
jgi:glutathione S-transferase